jgi:hypothetical protein
VALSPDWLNVFVSAEGRGKSKYNTELRVPKPAIERLFYSGDQVEIYCGNNLGGPDVGNKQAPRVWEKSHNPVTLHPELFP